MNRQAKVFIRGMNQDAALTKYVKDGVLQFAYNLTNVELDSEDGANEKYSLKSIQEEKAIQTIDGIYKAHIEFRDKLLLLVYDGKNTLNAYILKPDATDILKVEGAPMTLDYHGEEISEIIPFDNLGEEWYYMTIGAILYKFNPTIGFLKVIPELGGQEFAGNFVVDQIYDLGYFLTGTTQFAATLIYDDEVETNFVSISPLYYNTPGKKAVKPDYDGTGVSYEVTYVAQNPTTDSRGKSDYLPTKLCIYTIYRAQQNGTPRLSRKIVDLKYEVAGAHTTTKCLFGSAIIDGSEEIIDALPTQISNLKAKTLAVKHNVLFAGNITSDDTINWSNAGDMAIYDEIVQKMGDKIELKTEEALKKQYNITKGGYTIIDQIPGSSYDVTTLKNGNTYVLGIQLCDKYGNWSDPIELGHKTVDATVTSVGDKAFSGIPKFSFSCPTKGLVEAIAEWEKKDEIVAVRPVIVYPVGTEEKAKAQAVINPTVTTVGDIRNKTGVAAYASSFFRPIVNKPSEEDAAVMVKLVHSEESAGMRYRNCPVRLMDETKDVVQSKNFNTTEGCYAEFRHQYALGFAVSANCETPSNIWNTKDLFKSNKTAEDFNGQIKNMYDASLEDDAETWPFIGIFDDYTIVNSKICTLDSPDIDRFPTSNVSLRVSAAERYVSRIAKQIVNASAAFCGNEGDLTGIGQVRENFNTDDPVKSACPIIAIPNWRSAAANCASATADWVLFPYQPEKLILSEYNAEKLKENNWLNYKQLANLRVGNLEFVYGTTYGEQSKDCIIASDKKIVICQEANSSCALDSGSFIKNVDKLLKPFNSAWLFDRTIYIWDNAFTEGTDCFAACPRNFSYAFNCNNFRDGKLPTWYGGSIFAEDLKPIDCPNSKKYADWSDNYDKTFFAVVWPPFISRKNDEHKVIGRDGNYSFQWKYNTCKTAVVELDSPLEKLIADNVYASPVAFANQYLVDIESTDIKNIEVGSTRAWYLAGPTATVSEYGSIFWRNGDWYMGRYDVLKSYPTSLDDLNQQIEIGSFAMYSKTNINGRYDKNIGELSTTIRPDAFNLINMSYTQPNNYFSFYQTFKDGVTNDFSTSICWSGVKVENEKIDSWGKLSMISSLKLESKYGDLLKLANINDSIVSFQTNSICKILYDENVQIATNIGEPIELSRSGKVQGFVPIVTDKKILKKSHITTTDSMFAFLDANSKSLFHSSKDLTNLSYEGGMDSFFNNLDDITLMYFDRTNNSLNVGLDKRYLKYNFNIRQFESFYTVPGVRIDVFTASKNRVFLDQDISEEGKSSVVLKTTDPSGIYKDMETTFIFDDGTSSEKQFDTITYSGDLRMNNVNFLNIPNQNNVEEAMPITRLAMWNNFQTVSERVLTCKRIGRSDVKKKWSEWNIQVPRADSTGAIMRQQRIRSPWVFITFKRCNEDYKEDSTKLMKTVINELIINYVV